jgi:hypothetical protein
MARILPDWLSSYVKYASFTEAPAHMHFWVGVFTIAAALGRKVWIPMPTFCWYPNCYLVLVGPPDIVSKSTTMNMGVKLLKQIPGFQLGPTSCSWQALVRRMEKMEMDHDLGDGKIIKLSSCTVCASELGVFLKTQDTDFLDTMIHLWDGDTIDKDLIKEGGSVYIENPLLTLGGCTTPSWVATNIPEHMLEGGLLSRVIFVYADAIDHPVALPDEHVPTTFHQQQQDLLSDLIEIERMKGPLTISKEARLFMNKWYNQMKSTLNGDEQARDRVTRKQTHVFKLAIILSASSGDTREISLANLQMAVKEIEKLSHYRSVVVDSIGRSAETIAADRVLEIVTKAGSIGMDTVYRAVHSQLPSNTAFIDIISGLVRAKYIKERVVGDGVVLISLRGKHEATEK